MFEFVLIQPGTFRMGSPEDEINRWDDETRHRVTLTRPFYMQSTPVTQEQWESVMRNNPSYFKGENLPVEQVSWNDVQEFIARLNSSGEDVYRLPTEAEWEYCCRAGSQSAFYFGDDEAEMDDYAWYQHNSDGQIHPVGQKKPNAWGLYDMHGNVYEWVQDLYGAYTSDAVCDPQGPSTGVGRVVRGGCWDYEARYARSANRGGNSPDYRYGYLGFRLVKEVE